MNNGRNKHETAAIRTLQELTRLEYNQSASKRNALCDKFTRSVVDAAVKEVRKEFRELARSLGGVPTETVTESSADQARPDHKRS